MKKLIRAAFAVMLILSGALMSCGQSGAISAINPDQFETMTKASPDSIVVIDVRTPGEYADGHLAGASNINVQSEDFRNRVGQIDKSKTVIVYCKSGRRSSMAAEQLAEMGFTKVYNLTGGFDNWKQAGKAVE